MAAYYVYENWRAHGHQATLHRGECGSCNHGQGKQLSASTANGRWHGPYKTRVDAEAAARGTGGLVRACGHCAP